jgi:hypothetical protein
MPVRAAHRKLRKDHGPVGPLSFWGNLPSWGVIAFGLPALISSATS